MADAKIEFIDVTSLRAEAIGEPGERTFRILVDSSIGSAIIWLEKEQLFQLAVAIEQLMSNLPESDSTPGAQVAQSEALPTVSLELKVGKLALGRDETSGRFIIDAHDVESDENDPPTVRVWGGSSHAKGFSEEALRVCAAGRPTCPLCGGPMDPSGHMCPRSNGHGLVDLNRLEDR